MRAHRPRMMAQRAARACSAAGAARAAGSPPRSRRCRRLGTGSGIGWRSVAHRRRITAPVGSVFELVTSTSSASVDLAGRRAADLAHAFEDVVVAVDVGLREAAAVRVDRQRAVRPGVLPAATNGPLSPRLAEAVVLEAQQHRRAEVVEEHRRVDVGRRDAGHRVELLGDGAAAGVLTAGARSSRPSGCGSAPRPARRRGCTPGGWRAVAGALRRGDDHRAGAVGLQAAVEQAQRLGDPARALVIGERDRLAHDRVADCAPRARAARPRPGRSARSSCRTRACGGDRSSPSPAPASPGRRGRGTGRSR